MALPDKNQKPNLDSGPTHSPRPLWSRIAATMKSSLMYNDTMTSTDSDGLNTLKSLVFRVGKSTNSLMFDVTSRHESQLDFLRIIATQLPNRWGVAFHKEGSRKIVELNFLNPIDTDNAISTGLLFTDTNTRILPTPALNRESHIARIHLSDLPFLSEDELVIGLRQSLKNYGHVLDLGISRERNYNTYVGQGYAVLDLYQTIDNEKEYLPLNHNIPWADSTTDGIKATWHNMPPYCTYCHDSSGTHNANDCPTKSSRYKKAKPSTALKLACWNCESTDHVKRDCPQLKPRKISTPNQEIFT